VHWQDEKGGPGYWAVTKYHDCVTVSRDFDRFSSAAKGTMPFDLGEDQIAQQGLMMRNMDPPLHTRARMEIRIMFEHLLDRLPDIHPDGEAQRVQSQFINGVKHLPLAFTPTALQGR
jgi:cytochrome P450